MIIDATFWVAVSFVIFVGILFYFKIPQKVHALLDESINKIKNDVEKAEKLKDEAKSILSEYESKLSKSKEEVRSLVDKAKNENEKNVIRKNQEFHQIIENRKKLAEEKIRQMKAEAIRELRNFSVSIAIQSTEKIIKNSIDKKKLDKIYVTSIEETKKILKNKSI
tara:strand:- start:3 stop:500 length:498 start_codon:yes stop_codon:yes gene_type:complete